MSHRNGRTGFYRKGLALALAIFAGSLFSACVTAHYQTGIVDTPHVLYQVKPPGTPWEKVSVGKADMTYWNDPLKGFISISSTCEGFRDAPVRALANHLFFGIEDKQILVQKETPLDGRDAVYTEITGKLDGAPVKVAAYTMVKDYCTYDFSYSAPPDRFDQGSAVFDAVAHSFKVLKRKKI